MTKPPNAVDLHRVTPKHQHHLAVVGRPYRGCGWWNQCMEALVQRPRKFLNLTMPQPPWPGLPVISLE
jgi:hypothetical protein